MPAGGGARRLALTLGLHGGLDVRRGSCRNDPMSGDGRQPRRYRPLTSGSASGFAPEPDFRPVSS
jgi:hypothetical protein